MDHRKKPRKRGQETRKDYASAKISQRITENQRRKVAAWAAHSGTSEAVALRSILEQYPWPTCHTGTPKPPAEDRNTAKSPAI